LHQCTLIDPGDAAPVKVFLTENQLSLHAILITHHHQDHMGGVPELMQAHPCPVYGPETIPLCSHPVCDQDIINLQDVNLKFTVMATPGHTLDHLVYFNDDMLFCGDTLFSAGCGRVFEGSAEQLFTSLKKIAQLDDQTLVYCGHEYTINNLKFASHVEPKNNTIKSRLLVCKKQKCTLPSTIAIEKSTNPFLRCHHSTLQQLFDINDDFQLFKTLRKKKDTW